MLVVKHDTYTALSGYIQLVPSIRIIKAQMAMVFEPYAPGKSMHFSVQ